MSAEGGVKIRLPTVLLCSKQEYPYALLYRKHRRMYIIIFRRLGGVLLVEVGESPWAEVNSVHSRQSAVDLLVWRQAACWNIQCELRYVYKSTLHSSRRQTLNRQTSTKQSPSALNRNASSTQTRHPWASCRNNELTLSTTANNSTHAGLQPSNNGYRPEKWLARGSTSATAVSSNSQAPRSA